MVENIKLTNEATLATLELDMVTTPYYVLEKVDWGQISATHHSFKYVNQIGLYVTGTSLETRDGVSIIGWVIADTENQMTERKKVLNRFVNPQQVLKMEYRDYVLEILPKKTVQYSASIEENNEVMCKFQISATAFDPLFRKSVENRVAAATTRGMFHFPLKIGAIDNGYPTIMFGLRQPSLIIDVYNSGAVKTGIRMVFKALGTLKNPSLINVNTQQYFKINKTMSPGEEIEVNTTIGVKKIIGRINGEEFNYFKYRDFDSKWLQLETGDNLFRYDAEENIGGLEVYIYFNNRYLEVQECN